MTAYGDYTTVYNCRSTYLGSAQSTDDTLILDIIRQVSREIDALTNRHFYPLIGTRYYDTPVSRSIMLDDDLLEATTVTNGDTSIVSASDYLLWPANVSPKDRIEYKPSKGIWQLGGDGYPFQAVSIAGVWGFTRDYINAWQLTGATLSAAITTTSATTFTCTTGRLKAGDLILIDTEYLYVSAVTVSTSDTVTVVRGVNGSTAAAHLISTAIERWVYMAEITMLATQAVAAYYRLRSNPGMDSTVSIDGNSFATPQDVIAYMRRRLEFVSGIYRLGFA